MRLMRPHRARARGISPASCRAQCSRRLRGSADLRIQLVFYRGDKECSHSAWTDDAQKLAAQMRRIRCEAGATKIARTLRHIRAEHAREKVAAAIFVGDAVEEVPGELYDAAAGLPPVFFFQEGDSVLVHIDRHGQIVAAHPPQTVEAVFRELARLTRGAYGKFNAGAAKQLGEFLRAVAVYAVGGLGALADQRTDGARKLLSQDEIGAVMDHDNELVALRLCAAHACKERRR